MATIVIVENDLDIGPLMEQLLLLEGHKPILVADPAEAMEVIRREMPDLIYLDVRLTEEIDGFAVLREVRAETDTPVLMCSGLDVETKCLEEGANAFLLKPFDFNDLLDGVKRAFANGAAGKR